MIRRAHYCGIGAAAPAALVVEPRGKLTWVCALCACLAEQPVLTTCSTARPPLPWAIPPQACLGCLTTANAEIVLELIDPKLRSDV